MADRKWVESLAPRMSLIEAARTVLPARLKVVLHYLPLATTAAAKDVEHVHHLRVSTRRASAALDLFAACLPEKRLRSIQKLLRKIRRAAGAARDWDVFAGSLAELPILQVAATRPALDFLRGVAAIRRADAQVTLVAMGPSAEKKLRAEVLAVFDDSPALEEPDRERTFSDLGLQNVESLRRELESIVSSQAESYEELHRVRILGKRLRYSMETFVDCFASPFREALYPAIEEMQDILGKVTDSHVAAERIAALRDYMKAFQRKQWARYQKTIEQLLRSYRAVFPRERKRFRSWRPRWEKLAKQYPLDEIALAANASPRID